MRLISAFIITLISAVIVFTSFELKAWTNNIRTKDVQSFVRYSDTQLNLTSWEEYLEREIELIPISEKIGNTSDGLVSAEDIIIILLYKFV